MKKRKYTKTLRAEQQDETRSRIVDALVALHQEVGPLKTSVKAIAEKAGVQRLTVYRHFPDEASMLQACSSHYVATHPLPDMANWAAIDDQFQRSAAALRALYAYYQQTHAMWHSVYRDLDQLDALQDAMRGFEDYLDMVCSELVQGWDQNAKVAASLQRTLRHALRFSTWQSLEKDHTPDDAKAELVTAWLFGIIQKREAKRK